MTLNFEGTTSFARPPVTGSGRADEFFLTLYTLSFLGNAFESAEDGLNYLDQVAGLTE